MGAQYNHSVFKKWENKAESEEHGYRCSPHKGRAAALKLEKEQQVKHVTWDI